MFKKLRQKIEEGGEGGLDNVSFSPNKLPGSIVRSTSDDERKRISNSPQLDVLPEPQSPSLAPDSVAISKWEHQKGEFPSHLSSKSHLDYQCMLEARVRELEQECSTLNKRLSEEAAKHLSEESSLQAKITELDRKETELKMQIVELELEMVKRQEQHEGNSIELQDKLHKQKEIANEQSAIWMKQVNQLKAEIEEKERNLICEENKYNILEKKAHHFESQLKAYESASENEVVNRLHYEVADVEQRVKSRNLEIQILERRLASQAKENEEQIDKLLSRQEGLEKISKELTQVVKEGKNTNRELLMELENVQQKNTEMIKENEDLKTQLAVQSLAHQSLATECEQLQIRHDERIQELDHVLEDKEKYIKQLLHQLKQLKGNAVLQATPHPPGVARRTASMGVQTLPNPPNVDSEPAILPVAHGNYCVPNTNSSPVTMTSLSSDEALDVMKEQQLRLEEELSEKLKIIKVQQQKIMDIKKELRLQKTSIMPNDSGHPKRSPSPPISTTTLRVAIASDVNFQYLKHVVIKFMCSREDEALQLIRAVSTLLEFTQQEEEHVKSYLNYKMSWFGALPPPLFPPMPTIK